MNTWIEIDTVGADGYHQTVAELGPFPDDEVYTEAFADNLHGLTVGDIAGYSNFEYWNLPVALGTVIEAAYSVFKG